MEPGSRKNGFVQTSDTSLSQRIALTKYPIACGIMQILTSAMTKYNKVLISTITLSEKLDVTPRTIQRAIKWLNDNNYLNIKKSGTSNVYIINDQIYWRGKTEDRKYSEFEAHIILSSSENPDYEDDNELTMNLTPEEFERLRSEGFS